MLKKHSNGENSAQLRQLTEERDQLQYLLESTHDAIMLLRKDGTISYWNRGAEDKYGWSREEAIDNRVQRLLKTEYPKPLHEIEEEFQRTGHWEGELIHTKKDGSRVVVLSRWELQPSDFQVAAFELIQDPVAFQRAEKALFESESMFYGIMEAAPDALVVVDSQGQIAYINSQTEHVFGYDREELLGKTIEVLIPERFRESHLRQRDEYVAHPRKRPMGIGMELWGRRKDGSEFPVEIALSPIRTEESMLITAAIRDITERKKASEALSESQERFERAFEFAATGMALVSLEGRWLRVNRALCKILGYSEQELLEKSFQDHTHPDDLEKSEEAYRKLNSGELETYQMENRYRHEDGHVVWAWLSVSLVHHQKGAPLYAIAQIQDITERKRIEQEVRDRSAELERMNQHLQEIDRLKDEFVNTAAHELRTPLTSVMGYAEFLEEDFEGQLCLKHREFVSQIQAGARRLQRIVDDMLDFARLEAETLKLNLQSADLAQVIRTELESLRPQAKAAQLELLTRGLDSPVMAEIDPKRIGQVILNLVGNAIKFTRRGGSITVTLAHGPTEARIEVADSGIGISPQDQQHLFKKFFRVDQSNTREKGGTGLGLSITKALIEAHGGTIGASSEQGVGSTFWVTLPLVSKLNKEGRDSFA